MNYIKKYEKFLGLINDRGLGKILSKNDLIVLDLIEKIKLDWESDKNPNKIEFWPKNGKCNRIVYDSIDGGKSSIHFELFDRGKYIFGDGRPSKFNVSIVADGKSLYTLDPKKDYPDNEIAIEYGGDNDEGYHFYISNGLGYKIFKIFDRMKSESNKSINLNHDEEISYDEMAYYVELINDVLVDFSDEYDFKWKIGLFRRDVSTKSLLVYFSNIENKDIRFDKSLFIVIWYPYTDNNSIDRIKKILKSGLMDRLNLIDDRLVILPLEKITTKNQFSINAYVK